MNTAFALITGSAARGGAAIAKHLHGRGLRVVLHHSPRSADAAGELAAQLTALRADSTVLWCAEFSGRELDVPSWLVDSPVEICVCNASVWHPSDLDDFSRADADWAIHVASHARILSALRPSLRSVVAISDIHVERPKKGYVWYTVAKAALQSLMLSLAVEWAPTVRCNIIQPGALQLPEGMEAELEATILRSIPLARLGDFEDLAGAVAYLALDAKYVTGQVLALDGGRSRWLA